MPKDRTLGSALLLLAATVALQVAVAVVLSFVLTLVWRSRPPLGLVSGLTNLISLLTVARWGLRRWAILPRWTPTSWSWGWLVGLVLATAGGTIVLGELANLVQAAVPLSPAFAQQFQELFSGPLALTLFTVSFVAPLTEELLFRGLLLPRFVGRWGAGPGIVLSSALFALFHLNIWQAPSAFVAGLFLGWLAWRTGTLFWPMAVHALFNGLPLLLGAAGWHVEGYNTLPTSEAVFQPGTILLLGALCLGLGLWLSRRWAPLSPPPVSDTVTP